MQAIYKYLKLVCVLTTLIILGSCTKLVEIPGPKNQLSDQNIFENNETAISALTGIYIEMSSNETFTGLQSMSILTALSADELTVDNNLGTINHIGHYTNALSANAAVGSSLWGPLYNYIYKCNAAVEGLDMSNSLTPSIKQQLLGEAKFLRAFFYFYLTNLFGDVPLATTTDYKVNTLLSRSSQSQVYKLITDDLKEASVLLSPQYLDGSLQPYTATVERVRPTSWAAKSLLSRVYLYTGDYVNAQSEATDVINHSSLYSLSLLDDVFLMNSHEAIWQLQPVLIGRNTEDALTFIINSNGLDSEHPLHLSTQLLNDFEKDDHRRTEWIDSVTVLDLTYYFPHKYKSATINDPVTEYLMVLRLAEQYLIRSEARVKLGNLQGAAEDLNTLRARAGLPNAIAVTEEEMLSKILHERRVELFTEWGHRWLDLKRTSKVDEVMSTITPLKTNGSNWQSYQQLFPLPLEDIQSAPNLFQNPGY